MTGRRDDGTTDDGTTPALRGPGQLPASCRKQRRREDGRTPTGSHPKIVIANLAIDNCQPFPVFVQRIKWSSWSVVSRLRMAMCVMAPARDCTTT